MILANAETEPGSVLSSAARFLKFLQKLLSLQEGVPDCYCGLKGFLQEVSCYVAMAQDAHPGTIPSSRDNKVECSRSPSTQSSFDRFLVVYWIVRLSYGVLRENVKGNDRRYRPAALWSSP